MHTIMVLNAKGGSGKTTIATTLACHFAGKGYGTSMMDYDPQNSSCHWLSSRDSTQPKINSINACKQKTGLTRSFQLYSGGENDITIMDTPAGVAGPQLGDLVSRADTIIIPIMASVIDFHAAQGFIKEMMRMVKHRLHGKRLAIIANRVRPNGKINESIINLANEVDIPLITSLRDACSYTTAMESGLGICELQEYPGSRDHEEWQPVYEWLMKEIPLKEQPKREAVAKTEPEQLELIASNSAWDFSEANLAMS